MPTSNITELQVPQLSFNATSYTPYSLWSHKLAASAKLYILAYNTATLARPVPIASDFRNETYKVNFYGPSIRCGRADEATIVKATHKFGISESSIWWIFASWVGGNEIVPNSTDMSGYDQTLDKSSSDAARIFVMTNFAAMNPEDNGDTRVNVTECLLYNASYNVGFDFQYPNQTVQISVLDLLNTITYDKIGYVDAEASKTESASNAYLAIMQTFGRLLVGAYQNNYTGEGEKAYFTIFNLLHINWSSGEAVQAGLEQLFQNITVSLMSDKHLM
jgi:hypothetical protein